MWGPLFYRTIVSDQVFAGIPTIHLPNRPPLPGDYFVTRAGAIDQFMIRLKHSLRDAREMLSNTVAFWMVQELANKTWNPAAVDIPGFPPGVAGHPVVTLKLRPLARAAAGLLGATAAARPCCRSACPHHGRCAPRWFV